MLIQHAKHCCYKELYSAIPNKLTCVFSFLIICIECKNKTKTLKPTDSLIINEELKYLHPGVKTKKLTDKY